MTGEPANYLIRPDEPRVVKGRAQKYELPGGSRVSLDVPPGIREQLGDPMVPLFITEGARKADSAVSKGLCCISVIGVWNWRGTNESGGKTVLADFEAIALNERRRVYLAFDSDLTTKPGVHTALKRLKAFLEARGAEVLIVHLPSGGDGTKVGLDDYLAAGHTVDDLLGLASADLPSLPQTANDVEYIETESGIVWNKQTDHGRTTAPVPLTNFTARIVSDVTQDDGVEKEQRFEIEAELHGHRSKFSIESSRFASMSWPIEHLGAGAILEPGQGTKDRARHAIQTLSGDIPRQVAIGHLGWRRIGEAHYYVHTGGAIGADEVLEDIEVAVSEPLQPFELPVPPDGERLRESINRTLGMLEGVKGEIAYTLLSVIGRAPLGHCDSTIWLFGETGTFKSELAALCQQHWGRGLDARHLPATFTATANYIEGLLFTAQDVLAVVDDFAPEGSSHDIQRAHRDAARVIRSQGNLSARGRMRADSGLRPIKPPRGLLLGTGEEVPRGHSVRARMVIVGIETGDVDVAKLTKLQKAAAAGTFAETMAGYVRYLAGRYDEVRRLAQQQIAAVREDLGGGEVHRRTPGAVAQLLVGLRCFLDFARDTGAISTDEAVKLEESGRAALERVGHLQRAYLTSSEPAGRFIELLGSAISSGGAHVADPSGGEPSEPGLWGWRHVEGGISTSWRAQGSRVGWVDGDDLWLDPDAAYAAAQDIARRVGDPFTVARTTLNKRLSERGFLTSTDLESKRNCVPVRRVIGGSRPQVLHMSAARLVVPDVVPDAEIDRPSFGVDDGRDGRTPEIRNLPEDGGGTHPAAPPVGTDTTGVGEPDHPDQTPAATEEEEAEIRRVARKFGVTGESDA